MFLGEKNAEWAELPDINARELIALVPLAALVIALGVMPSLATDLSKASVNGLEVVQEMLAKFANL